MDSVPVKEKLMVNVKKFNDMHQNLSRTTLKSDLIGDVKGLLRFESKNLGERW